MSVKFKMCDRCMVKKTDPLSRNWVSPGVRFCPPCEREMLQEFLEHLGHDVEDAYTHCMNVKE